MSDPKKDRVNILDNLTGYPALQAMKPINRTVQSARVAMDAVKVWELDPDQIEDTRIADRLNLKDVDDLRASIETSGQTVPILVRAHPTEEDKYLLVNGARRLEAIRSSLQVSKVRAIISPLDENAAVEAQITENTARRDLTYIEKALFAYHLVNSNFGSRGEVAEIFGVKKSWMSMAFKIVETVTPEVIQSIGPTPGIGRPRWEGFAKAFEAKKLARPKTLIELAEKNHEVLKEYPDALVKNGEEIDPSVAVFEKLELYLTRKSLGENKEPEDRKPRVRPLSINGTTTGSVMRSGKKVRLEVEPGEFADFVEAKAQYLLEQMHKLWREEQAKNKKS